MATINENRIVPITVVDFFSNVLANSYSATLLSATNITIT